MGDIYWRIDDRGSVDNCMYNNYYTDNHRQAIGNFFKTKEQAEFAVEKLKVEAELRKFSKSYETLSRNWLIAEAKDGTVETLWSSHSKSQGTLYFESEEKANEAIEVVGEERIKKYIFGVED